MIERIETITNATRLRIEDEIVEIELRQSLRRVLFAAYELLTDPNADAEDADRVTKLILDALQDTTP